MHTNWKTDLNNLKIDLRTELGELDNKIDRFIHKTAVWGGLGSIMFGCILAALVRFIFDQ